MGRMGARGLVWRSKSVMPGESTKGEHDDSLICEARIFHSHGRRRTSPSTGGNPEKGGKLLLASRAHPWVTGLFESPAWPKDISGVGVPRDKIEGNES